MAAPTIETFISENAIPRNPFRIGQSYKPDWGAFVVTRYLYSITATGGETWQRCLFYLVFTFALSPLALAVDLAALAFYGAILLVKRIAEGLFLAVVNIIQAAFSKFLNTTLTIAAVVLVVLALYYRWNDITYFIKYILYYKFF